MTSYWSAVVTCVGELIPLYEIQNFTLCSSWLMLCVNLTPGLFQNEHLKHCDLWGEKNKRYMLTYVYWAVHHLDS